MRWFEHDQKNIILDYENGLTKQKIVKKYHIGDKTLEQILKNNNIANFPGRTFTPIDLTGQIFGYWKALELDHIKKNPTHWLCICTKCGIIKSMPYMCLKNKKSYSQCWDCYIISLKRLPNFVSNRIVKYYRATAKKRNIEFLVTQKYLQDKLDSQCGMCQISGVPIWFPETDSKKYKEKRCGTASLDRIDSRLGYINGNVQWVHKNVNIMKLNLDEQVFLYYIKMIALFEGIDKTIVFTPTIEKYGIGWEGCGNISKMVYSRSKKRAEIRNLDFDISIEFMWEKFLEQKGKCNLTGIDLQFNKKIGSKITASLDRIDSNLGYVQKNVQWVHKTVNFIKMNLDQNHLISFCKQINEYQTSKVV